MATLLAVHLVSQVLDEAYVIANAAHDSGQPWQYVSGLKKIKNYSLNETYEKEQKLEPVFGGNKEENQNKLHKTPSKIATSTPQKALGNPANVNDHSLIGQGDEEFTVDTDESKSTSLFITNLFDMSDVERDMSFSEPVLMQNKLEPHDVIINAMKKMMDHFVESALNYVSGQELSINDDRAKSSMETTTSSYSFLTDAAADEDGEGELLLRDIEDITNNETTNKHDIASYENAYLTLNRDYEQYSDDEEPVLQDPKGLSMHEIELMAAGSAGDNCPQEKEAKNKELAAISGVSSSGLGSKKSSLVRRCRSQGARLLSCLRGWWWRRKLHGKRRDSRMHGSIRGICPLSPDARRRAASLLDQRHLRTPSPSRSVVWKFNTVNEALVHSAQWKEFSSKMDFNENENS
ncbi:unnamed protein product [Colias eurytheme]|nr:unnamed protein product [Colias eurytheme]